MNEDQVDLMTAAATASVIVENNASVTVVGSAMAGIRHLFYHKHSYLATLSLDNAFISICAYIAATYLLLW